ncbi:MAG: MAPEG family protein [Bdellovibrio sp.]|nr:MAPEG family protein [Bdellovibrio sp.]
MLNILPYAAILTALFVVLSIRIIKLRRTLKIGLGDIGNDQMLRAVRVNANFAEYVPLSLLMIYLVETQGALPAFVHTLGILLLVGRFSHAFGVSHTKENFKFRVVGMAMTFTVLLLSATYLFFKYLLR